MKNLLWFLFGIAGGFVVAHLVNKDPRGHEVLAEVDARITEFTDRIGDAYREQEARMSGWSTTSRTPPPKPPRQPRPRQPVRRVPQPTPPRSSPTDRAAVPRPAQRGVDRAHSEDPE